MNIDYVSQLVGVAMITFMALRLGKKPFIEGSTAKAKFLFWLIVLLVSYVTYIMFWGTK